MKYSIIIVTYNNEPHIAEAVRSCIFKGMSDYEVIVVYNKSDDYTLDKIQAAISGHEQTFRIIQNAENVGLGEARNQGIRAAKGEYILFLDGDDWFAPDALSTVDRFISLHKPEILQFNFTRVYEGGKLAYNDRPKLLAERWRTTPRQRSALLRNFGTAWNRAYRADFIRTHNLSFPTGLYEDFLWNIETLARAARIYVIPNTIILYRQRHGSILRSTSPSHFDALSAHKAVCSFFKSNPALIPWFGVRSYKAVRRQGYAMLFSGRLPLSLRGQYLRLENQVLSDLRSILKRKKLSLEDRVARLNSYLLLSAYRKCRSYWLRFVRRLRSSTV
jgi:glycosyltransferase involved in cell wall biosynthesis